MYKKQKQVIASCLVGMLASTTVFSAGMTPTVPVYAAELDEATRTEIETSLYDFQYYCMANEDVAVALGYDEDKMYEHWLNYGMAEGRNASMVFNAKYYLEVNPSVKASVGEDYIAAYEHFVEVGLLEGLESSPVFSVKYYLEANEDVAEVFGNDYIKAANHFNQNALVEGRSGSGNFDYTVYKYCNTDVADLYGDQIKGYYIHYINHGRAEGRTAGWVTNGDTGIDKNANSYRIFDAEFYLENYPELAQSVGTEKDALYTYWLEEGIALGQSASPVFDPVEYLSINEDVAEAVGQDYEAAANHFFHDGIEEGRSGSREFDYTVYKDCNTDVVEEFGEDIVGYYFHYVNYGRAENRTATLVMGGGSETPETPEIPETPETPEEETFSVYNEETEMNFELTFEDGRLVTQKYNDLYYWDTVGKNIITYDENGGLYMDCYRYDIYEDEWIHAGSGSSYYCYEDNKEKYFVKEIKAQEEDIWYVDNIKVEGENVSCTFHFIEEKTGRTGFYQDGILVQEKVDSYRDDNTIKSYIWYEYYEDGTIKSESKYYNNGQDESSYSISYSYKYNENGIMIEKRDSINASYYYIRKYNDQGKQIKDTIYKEADDTIKEYILWEYYGDGTVKQESKYLGSGIHTPAYIQKYSELGVISEKIEYSYMGENGDILNEYNVQEYDRKGNIIKKTFYSADSFVIAYTLWEYYVGGSLQQESHYFGTGTDIPCYIYKYNEAGFPVEKSDYEYQYSVYDSYEDRIYFLRYYVIEKYNEQGNKLRKTIYNNDHTISEYTVYEYDENGEYIGSNTYWP